MISIITVCFNSEKTIGANIRSVAKQSYNNFEHIIIDGGSSDTTLKKIESSLTSPNTTLISEPDRGIYDAMNKGLRLANGEIICFLNSDDLFADDLVLATVVRGMKEYGCDLLYGDVDFF
jgi:glycosyltransferase involved in cell wall biosynthesis